MKVENEIWKDIEGYEGLYQISNYGRIKSLEKYIKSGIKNSKKVKRKEKILKIQENRYGYNYVNLSKNSEHKYKTIHRLVAQAFIPNPQNKPQVNHIDGDKTNNCISNLEWCTSSENEIHAYKFLNKHKNNGNKGKFGKENAKAKVVLQIDKYTNKILNKYYGISEAERKTGISNQSISKCCLKRKGYFTAGGFKWRYADENNN